MLTNFCICRKKSRKSKKKRSKKSSSSKSSSSECSGSELEDMKKQHNKKAKRREQRQKRVIFLIAKTTKWNKILSWPLANVSKGIFATFLLDANDIIIINS